MSGVCQFRKSFLEPQNLDVGILQDHGALRVRAVDDEARGLRSFQIRARSMVKIGSGLRERRCWPTSQMVFLWL